MLTRRLAPEPVAEAADRSRWCAAFGSVLAAMAVLMARSGSVDPRGALAVLGFALIFAALAIVLALWSAVVIWRTGRRGTARALLALVIGAAILAYPAYLATLAARLPAGHAVSPDPAAPPPFSPAPTAVAARGGVAHPEPSAEAQEAEHRAYPGLTPVMLDMPADEAYALALRTVEAHRWRVVEAVPPRGKFGTGHIDAVATTPIMALPDDVTIRIRPASGQTRVDIRSASRFGRSDLGANAARIQSLSDELLDADS